LLKPDPRAFAAGFQCAFRFNTYIGLALISRLHGDAGVAGMSLLLGAVVPIANVAAVWSLAHRSGNVRREIARNPLIISTLSGIAFSLLGLSLPEAVWQMLARLGSVSLPLGLLAVGAALQLKGVGAQRALIAWFTAVKLLVVPATAYALALAFDLDILSLHIVILFGALPAATSAYILAERMGGDGKVVAAIISFSTLAAMLSLPLWLAAVGAGANAS
jgi:predicted permease